jgi:hypothetical protein
MTKKPSELSDDEVRARREDALRRALNTPPKQHKDMKKGAKKKQDERPTPSSEKRT